MSNNFWTRPPIPVGAHPRYALANRMAQHNLRPVVLFIAFLAALWSLFGTIANFRAVSVDDSEGFRKLGVISLALGAIYAVALAFESFGILAAATQRLAFVRIYAYLSVLSALIVIAGEFILVIVHFTNKNDIINECTAISTDGNAIYPYGFFGPVYRDFDNPEDAKEWCQSSYSHTSWVGIIQLIILMVLAVLFTLVSFAYYRQILDPTSAANRARGPVNNFGGYDQPSHYNPPYNATVPTLGYGSAPMYAPPPGPPPNRSFDDGKPPGYEGGDGLAGAGYSADKKDDNPFSDFTENYDYERDVTSRPGPGERGTFN